MKELYTDDCVVYVPPGAFIGHEALDKLAGALRATHPHFVYTPHGEPQVLHNAGCLAWGSGPRGEKPNYTGLDVIVVRDNKIISAAVAAACATRPVGAPTTRYQIRGRARRSSA